MVDDLDSPIADLQNAKIGDPAVDRCSRGSSSATSSVACPMRPTRPRIPWVHLDIAGVGMNKAAPFGYTDKGVTGATVRSLVEMISAGGAR